MLHIKKLRPCFQYGCLFSDGNHLPSPELLCFRAEAVTTKGSPGGKMERYMDLVFTLR